MNESQLDQLRNTLRRESQHIQPVGLGAETVRRRGHRRRNRGRAAVALGAATCVAGLGVSVIERGSGTPPRVTVGSQSAAPTTPSLAFRVITGTVTNESTHFTSAAGVTYALSTAPGTSGADLQPNQAIYSTSDGEHWTSATQDKPWISDLTENNGVLYAVGTAPGAATAADVQYQIATSHNGGGAWSDANLPFDLSTPTATVPMTRSSSVHIASGAKGTVAVLDEFFSPDIDAQVAAIAAGRPNVTSRQTSTGYDVVDMSSCGAKEKAAALGAAATPPNAVERVGIKAGCTDAPVLGHISWSDLGLSGAGELTHQEVLVSTDGAHWQSAPAANTGSVDNLVATNDGFLLLAENNDPVGAQATAPSTTLLHSTDAQTWTNVATPAGLNVQAISADEILGTDASGAVQTSADGGATWNATAVNSLLPAGTPAMSVAATDAGPLGFAVLAAPNGQVSGPDYLLFSTDGINWTTTNLASVGEPTTGYPLEVTVGADHVSVDYAASNPTPGAASPITTLLGTPKA